MFQPCYIIFVSVPQSDSLQSFFVFETFWKDETGEDGVVVLPESSIKKVRIGNKVSSEKVKQDEHESATQMREAHDRAVEKQKISTNEQVG